MADAERVTARQRAILTAIVASYIDTGEPVGSGTISRLGPQEVAGLSSATVRNEMAALVDAGLLEQPHTSAGRVPTARAFRMYVEQINGVPGLSAGSRQQIDSSFAGLTGTQAVLERTSHVLATLSSGVGVAIAAIAGGDMLEHVHFSRLTEARVLAVVVTKSGLVRDRVLALDRDLTPGELETAANFLNEHFRGWNIEGVRREIARLVEQERSEYQRLLSSVQRLWDGTVPETDAPRQTVYLEGVANLVTSQARQEDRERLREVLMALEAKQRVVALLNAYIDARQESVRVVFDLEEQAPELAGLVLIAAPARMAGENRGTVGVIGPKRMQYERTMSAVSYIARVFDRMLEPAAVKAKSWDRFADGVARWAGIGNNRENDTRSEEAMQDETIVEQGVQEPEILSSPEGAVEAAPVAAELEQLKGERDQLQDRLARLQAEFDNARKREMKERADARDYTITQTVEPFLGVMDNFQLALKADGTAEQLRGGVELILKQMEDALKGLNVQPVESVGTQFDPRVHEALGNIETLEFPDHQVLEEIRRGYKIRDKLLRPALVRIASNTGQVSE